MNKERKSKDRPTLTPNVVFVVASHYQSLQIIVLLLQACLLEFTSFVGYYRRIFKNCFQHRLVFYEPPVFAYTTYFELGNWHFIEYKMAV